MSVNFLKQLITLKDACKKGGVLEQRKFKSYRQNCKIVTG